MSLAVRVSALVRVGRTEEAARTSAEAATLARRVGDPRMLATVLRNEAAVWDRLGEYEEAWALGLEALAWHEATEDVWGELLARMNLVWQGACIRRFDDARAHALAARALVARVGPSLPRPYPDHELGWLELSLGRLDEARALLDGCIVDAERAGDDVQRAMSLGARAACRLAAGAAAAAVDDLEAALALKSRAPTPSHLAHADEALLALAFALDGRLDEARELRGRVEAHAARWPFRAVDDARRARPGVPIPSDALIDRVWPGDRSHPRDLANRLWVAVSALRRAGLGETLKTVDDGYLLDPDVPLVDAEPALEPPRGA